MNRNLYYQYNSTYHYLIFFILIYLYILNNVIDDFISRCKKKRN